MDDTRDLIHVIVKQSILLLLLSLNWFIAQGQK